MSEGAFWTGLEHKLEAMVTSFGGVAGIAVHDLSSDRRLAVLGDEPFPAASSIKIHLLAALFQLDHDGEISLDERVTIGDKAAGSGVLAYLDDRVELSWRDVANLMIIVSDNTATNMVIDRIGLDRMASFLRQWGLEHTVLARKMQDQAAVVAGLENLASPLDAVRMLQLLWHGEAFGDGVAQECLRILAKPKKSFFNASLPPEVGLANKGGSMDRVRCDAGIVRLERRPFAMAVMSKYGPSEGEAQARWVSDAGRCVYDAMAVLDVVSVHGQGIPAAMRSA